MMDASGDQLEVARRLIASGQRKEARKLLLVLCREQPSAESYWLLSRVLDDNLEIEKALQRALKRDPNHILAAEALCQLHPVPGFSSPTTLESLPLVSFDDSVVETGTHSADKGKRKKRSRLPLMLIFVVVMGVILGVSVPIIFNALTYVVPYPFTGAYYISRGAAVPGESLPCMTYTLYGDVVNGAGYSVRVTTDFGFDQSVVVGSDGRYRVDIPAEYVLRSSNLDENADQYSDLARHRIDQVVSFRLLDANGVEQSGIRTTPFYRFGCAAYYEFSPFPGGLKFGEPPARTGLAVVEPTYQVMKTELTSVPQSLRGNLALPCDWAGIIGRAYLQGELVNDIWVHAYSFRSAAQGRNHAYAGTTGDLAYVTRQPEFNGMWAIELPRDDRYYVTFSYQPPEYAPHDLAGTVVEIPEQTDCQGHVILMTLIPMEELEAPPYPL